MYNSSSTYIDIIITQYYYNLLHNKYVRVIKWMFIASLSSYYYSFMKQ